MRTDRIDLWQFHEMVYDSDPDWVFDKGGLTRQAAVEAQKAGKVRYIGFTGHKDPSIHAKMLNKPHDWDAAQMPINVMDAHYRMAELSEAGCSPVPRARRGRRRHEESRGRCPARCDPLSGAVTLRRPMRNAAATR